MLDDWLAEKDGRWASLTCGLSVPRQNGKNALIEVRELFGMVGRGERILHTAHEVKTARKAFKRLQFFFGSQRDDTAAKFPELNALVAEVRNTNGQEAIVLKNGGSVEVVARSKNSGRGFTVDVLIMDEAQEMSDDDIEALMPTTSSAPLRNPQWIFTGTPPGPSADGDVFTRTRATSLGKAARTCWHEWSAPSGVNVDDRDAWRAANPALLTGRLQFEVVEGERDRFSVPGFMRERLGMWADATARADIFGAGNWKACRADYVRGTPMAAIGVAATKSLADASLVAASLSGDRVQVRPLDRSDGLAWLPARVKQLQDEHDCEVIIDAGGPAGVLVPLLEQVGVKVTKPTVAEFFHANATMFDLVRSGRLAHEGYEVLDRQVEGAQLRTGERNVLDRKKSDVDILEAATLAAWGATRPREIKRSAYADDHDLMII